jgi:hypothetical protein
MKYIYLTNTHGTYFKISESAWRLFDRNYLVNASCVIHDSEAAMFKHIMKLHNLAIDEVEGAEIALDLINGTLYEIGTRWWPCDIDETDTANNWICNYRT